MHRKKKIFCYTLSEYFTPLDRILTKIHGNLFLKYKNTTILVSLAVYVIIQLIWGKTLKISGNYFVLIPLVTSTLSYGLIGGILAGPLGLPLNLIVFHITGHPEYAPENLLIAELSGITVGFVMGYMSDFFNKMNREIQKRRVTEEKLRKTLSDKEILLEEVHHRVRNNLNIIKSLIALQSSRASDPSFKEESEKLRQRIFSISLVHDQLFHNNNSVFLNLQEYLSSLIDNLLSLSVYQGISLNTRWPREDMPLESDKAIYIGLICQEVIVNALKYAFGETEFPELSFSLDIKNDRVHIAIADNGCGFDPDESFEGLGRKLIRSLTSQLDGNCSFRNRNGTEFTLDCPVR